MKNWKPQIFFRKKLYWSFGIGFLKSDYNMNFIMFEIVIYKQHIEIHL